MRTDAKYTDFFKPEDITVDRMWKIFVSTVYPNVKTDSVQYAEMRRCFYAGFIECFKIMDDLSMTLSEDDASEHLSRISKETREFFDKDILNLLRPRGNA